MQAKMTVSSAWLIVLLVASGPSEVLGTALDDYVAAPDSSYTFELDPAATVVDANLTVYFLNMTSQQWRTSAEVDRTLWKHWLMILVPHEVSGDRALLRISGGNDSSELPSVGPASWIVELAAETRTVAAILRTVPSQPLTFAGDGVSRVEDAILAYSFDRFLETGDSTWPALLPMVKSAVRAMDTVQAFMAELPESPATIEKFVLTGSSKRGWTTWLTAAVDPRVEAIVPVVFDVLNLDEQMEHHHHVYEGVTDRISGGYSDVIHDYVDMGVIQRLATPEGQALLEIVDPFEYRERFTMPKFLVNAPGDQFFVPDSARYYFDDLPGPKYMRYVPNTHHGTALSGATASIQVFYESVLSGARLPEFSWSVKEDGSIHVQTVDAPVGVVLWQATNAGARDFRWETIGPAWARSTLQDGGSGVYTARVAPPPSGYTGFFVELTFPSGGPAPFTFTTEVSVIEARTNFRRPGDCDEDGLLGVSDATCLLGVLFGGTPRQLPCGPNPTDAGNVSLLDSNGDERVDISDAVHVLGFLFLGTPAPVLGIECVPIAGCPTGASCP